MTDTTTETTTVETDTTTVISPEPVLVTLERDPKQVKGHGATRVLVPETEVDAWLAVGWIYAKE